MIIGTRGSALALAQSEQVRALLPGGPAAHRLVVIKTTGDVQANASFARIGGKGVFTKELEEALLRGEIDMAVHSLKDLPTEQRPGLWISAMLPREDPRDALVSRSGQTLELLPQGARVGTSSLRRRSQVLACRPDLRVEELRGNVPTRLKRVEEGGLDAVIVAAAGLKRLGLADRATQLIEERVMLPAPGQGVIAVQSRADDPKTGAAILTLHHPPTAAEAMAERTLLDALGGGCLVPVGARARAQGRNMELSGYVGHPDGRPSVRLSATGDTSGADALGRSLAQRMMAQGAGPILDEVRSQERFP